MSIKEIPSKPESGFWVGILSIALSVIGIGLIFRDGTEQRIIALSVVIASLILGLATAVYLLQRLKKESLADITTSMAEMREEFRNYLQTVNPQGYYIFSTSIFYSTEDGIRWKYELVRSIQCKQPFMKEFMYKFKWTGATIRSIVSQTHPLEGDGLQQITHAETRDVPDILVIPFSNNLWLNDVATIHFAMELEDPQKNAIPYVRYRVEHPVKFVQFHVELKHCQDLPPAKFECSLSKGGTGMARSIEMISFDKNSRSYRHILANPEIGFTYTLTWEKNYA